MQLVGGLEEGLKCLKPKISGLYLQAAALLQGVFVKLLPARLLERLEDGAHVSVSWPTGVPGVGSAGAYRRGACG